VKTAATVQLLRSAFDGVGGPQGLLALGMGREVARGTPPILQVENLSHRYWASWPRACSQPGWGLAAGLDWEGDRAVNHHALL
jgi:hypothetical protein